MMRAWIAGQPPILELRKQRGLTRDARRRTPARPARVEGGTAREGAPLLPRARDGSARAARRRPAGVGGAGGGASGERGRPRGLARPPLQAQPAFRMRTEAWSDGVVRSRGRAATGPPEEDEVDRLFRSGSLIHIQGACPMYDEPRAHQLAEPTTPPSAATSCRSRSSRSRRTCSVSRSRCATTCRSRGMLLPSERRILVRADEPEPRRRFTIAHELGHWVCQCLEGTAAAGLLPRRGDRRRPGGEGAGAGGEHLRREPPHAGGGRPRAPVARTASASATRRLRGGSTTSASPKKSPS